MRGANHDAVARARGPERSPRWRFCAGRPGPGDPGTSRSTLAIAAAAIVLAGFAFVLAFGLGRRDRRARGGVPLG